MVPVTKKAVKTKSVKTAANKSKEVKIDAGSPEAQVTIMTSRINELTEHLKINPKDHMARRGLLQLVGKRRRLLTYLAKQDSKTYLATIKKLGLRR